MWLNIYDAGRTENQKYCIHFSRLYKQHWPVYFLYRMFTAMSYKKWNMLHSLESLRRVPTYIHIFPFFYHVLNGTLSVLVCSFWAFSCHGNWWVDASTVILLGGCGHGVMFEVTSLWFGKSGKCATCISIIWVGQCWGRGDGGGGGGWLRL